MWLSAGTSIWMGTMLPCGTSAASLATAASTVVVVPVLCKLAAALSTALTLSVVVVVVVLVAAVFNAALSTTLLVLSRVVLVFAMLSTGDDAGICNVLRLPSSGAIFGAPTFAPVLPPNAATSTLDAFASTGLPPLRASSGV